MKAACQLVRVFDKPQEAQGNQAMVFFEGNPIDLPHERTRISADIYKQKGIATTCFISELMRGQYEVQCFNDTKAIQCCGHGMIAAAKTIFSDSNLSSIIINGNITASRNMDETGQDKVALILPRLSARLQAVPHWAREIITFDGETRLPNKAAVSTQDDGYLLLEFKPALSSEVFRTMKLDLKTVCENTKHAIVVVQFDQDKQLLYMRYFAPQYGVLEDSATGSVMRFVGDYIEQRYQIVHFDVSQCSPQGGFMTVECKAENIIITANASMEAN